MHEDIRSPVELITCQKVILIFRVNGIYQAVTVSGDGRRWNQDDWLWIELFNRGFEKVGEVLVCKAISYQSGFDDNLLIALIP